VRVQVLEHLVGARVVVVLFRVCVARDRLHARPLKVRIYLLDAPLIEAPVAREDDLGAALLDDRLQHVHARLAARPLLLVGWMEDAVHVEEHAFVRTRVAATHGVERSAKGVRYVCRGCGDR